MLVVSEDNEPPGQQVPGARSAAGLEGCAVVESDSDCSVGVDGGVVDEGSPGFRCVADYGVLAAVLVELRGPARD